MGEWTRHGRARRGARAPGQSCRLRFVPSAVRGRGRLCRAARKGHAASWNGRGSGAGGCAVVRPGHGGRRGGRVTGGPRGAHGGGALRRSASALVGGAREWRANWHASDSSVVTVTCTVRFGAPASPQQTAVDIAALTGATGAAHGGGRTLQHVIFAHASTPPTHPPAPHTDGGGHCHAHGRRGRRARPGHRRALLKRRRAGRLAGRRSAGHGCVGAPAGVLPAPLRGRVRCPI